MSSGMRIMVAFVAALLPASAFAEDTGFFTGLDVSGGRGFGSSSKKDGGASWASGGIVDNVEFGGTVGFGGQIGYKFDPALSAFISYRHIKGDVIWEATFPL